MSPPLLEARGLRVVRGTRTLLDEIDVQIDVGTRLAIVGPNGSGKSTLLRALLGLEKLAGGRVDFDGRDIRSLRRIEIARRAGLLSQETYVDIPLTVRELVEVGRFPHRGTTRQNEDRAAVERAMAEADVATLADRLVPTLSGGELQRAQLARALAQDTPVLLFDEPTASLDLRHQIRTLELLKRRADAGCGVAVVLHDLGLAARWASHVLVLREGRTVASGAPTEVLCASVISEAFGVALELVRVREAWALVPPE